MGLRSNGTYTFLSIDKGHLYFSVRTDNKTSISCRTETSCLSADPKVARMNEMTARYLYMVSRSDMRTGGRKTSWMLMIRPVALSKDIDGTCEK